jgi:2,3-bisphosphoglycerate-independent phosphoglycerate mutase
MGNSEVGHMNIGAGRVCYQDICRVEVSMERDQFKDNAQLCAAFAHARSHGGRLHLLGLVSDGGVHSHINHLKEILKQAKAAGVAHAFVHFIADGRDTRPKSAVEYMQDLLAFMAALEYGQVATVCGRYYAMDRDKRYERVQLAYDAYTQGKGEAIAAADILAVRWPALFSFCQHKCNPFLILSVCRPSTAAMLPTRQTSFSNQL